MSKSFQIIAEPTEYTLEEKRSHFIAKLFPVESREQALTYLDTEKQRYPDARHHCWAYIIGDTSQPKNVAFSDDGEPSGTAGKPILNVLTHRNAGNCVGIVIRYFGGIKLGAGGLVRAYGSAISNALDHAHFTTVEPSERLKITIDYALEDRIRHYLAEYKATLHHASYSDKVLLEVELPSIHVNELSKLISEISSGDAVIIKQGSDKT